MSDSPVPTLQAMLVHLSEVGSDWFMFGIALGVPISKMRDIETTHSKEGAMNCIVDAVQYWLDTTPAASWGHVAAALEQAGLLRLAAIIKRKYLWEHTLITDEERYFPHPPPRPPPPPLECTDSGAELTSDVKLRIVADGKIVRQLRDLTSDYSLMLTEFREQIRGCDISRAQFFLNKLLNTDAFTSCDNIEKILNQLCHHYIDIFNVYYLQLLATCLKRDDLKKLVKTYEKKKEEFLKNTAVLDFQKAVISKIKPHLPKGMVEVAIKIPKRLATMRTLRNMEVLAMEAFEDNQKSFVRFYAFAGTISADDELRTETGIGHTFLRHQIHQEGSKEKPAVQDVADAIQVDEPLASDEQTSHEPSSVIQDAKQQGMEVAVQLGGEKISEEQMSDPLTTREITHAYDVSLRASKEREQELQSQVDALQHQSIVKEQKLSKLEEDYSDMQKKMLILKNDYEQQQEVLEKLQQKAVKAKLSVEVAVQVDELVGYELETLISCGTSMTGDDSISQMKKKLDSVYTENKKQLSLLYRRIDGYESELQKLRSAVKRPTMKDVELQFNFLIPMSAHLRGVHVVGEKLFQISGEFPQLLEWEEYGLRIQVPKGATSAPCDIAIKAIVAGQFEFPDGTDLVSAVYAISVSKKLTQPVILEMQHCVAINDEVQGQFLSFVRAKCNQPDLPYLFKLLKNGEFPPHSDYGKIACDHFSIVGIVLGKSPLFNANIGHSSQVQQKVAELVTPPSEGDSDGLAVEGSARYSDDWKTAGDVVSKDSSTPSGSIHQSTETEDKAASNNIERPPMDYTAYVFYINSERNMWKMHFNVTKKLDALLQQVKKEHDVHDEATHFQFQFCGDEILLNLEKKCTDKGWSILPLVYPCKLLKQVVDSWVNATPSCCHVEVQAEDSSDTAPSLRYYVPVCGIIPKDTRFLISRRLQTTDVPAATSVQSDMALSSPPVTQGSLDKPPNILDLLNKVACKAGDKWEMMGLALGIELNQLNSFSKHADPIKCYMEVFSTWKKKTDPPFTWATVINSLKLPIVGETELAMEIEEWLRGLDK